MFMFQLILATEVLPARLVLQALPAELWIHFPELVNEVPAVWLQYPVDQAAARNIHSFLPLRFIMLALHISQY